jgi:hypothetical protein
MKNFTLIALCAMLFSTGSLVAQPMTAPTAPTQAAGDVVSILSNTYTPLAANFTPAMPAASLNFYPDWGQGTTFAEFPVAGNPIKRYNALDYQGIDFGGNINASGMTTLHWDIYTDVATTLRISLISNGTGERYVSRTTAVGWNRYDIPLTEYTSQSGFSVSSIFQFKFEEFPMAYRAGTKTVYLYNLYFWKPANVPTITGFSVPVKLTTDAPFALTAPTSNSSGAFTYMSDNPSVATISGSTVTIVGAGTSIITANQAAAGAFSAGSTSAVLTVSSPGPTTAAPTPIRPNTNIVSLFSGAYSDVAGTNWDAFHGDGVIYSAVDIAGNPTKKFANLNYIGAQTTPGFDITSQTHLHLDVWTANPDINFRVKLVNFGSPNTEAEVSVSPNTGGGVWKSYDILLSSFGALTSRANISQFIISSTNTTPTQTFWVDNVYFYTAPVPPSAPTAAASTPTVPAANVISLFSGAYTDAPTNWNAFGGATAYTEVTVAGNPTKKYDNLDYIGAVPASLINATAATTLHVDVWTPIDATFRIKLVDFGADLVVGGTDDREHELIFSVPGNAWTALDPLLSDFTTLTSRAHIGQFIISSPTVVVRALAGPTFFMDNVYFYSNVALGVELTNLTAKSVNKTTILNWQTASEKDNQGFTVERSLNGTDYAAIGQVKGFGTTNTVRNYTFTDATPTTGVNYYRLRQADFNGKESLSKVVSVISGKNFLVLKNTLVQNLLDVTVGEETKGSPASVRDFVALNIFNVSGQLVYSAKVQGNQLLDVSALTSGLYIVRTEAGDVSRFVKQ